MTSHNELIRTAGRLPRRDGEDEVVRGTQGATHIDALLARQAEMLVSIERDIGTTLFETLCAKIESEREFLLKSAANDARSARTKEYLNRTLNAERFTRRRLDANLL